jgi:hypothetical protein
VKHRIVNSFCSLCYSAFRGTSLKLKGTSKLIDLALKSPCCLKYSLIATLFKESTISFTVTLYLLAACLSMLRSNSLQIVLRLVPASDTVFLIKFESVFQNRKKRNAYVKLNGHRIINKIFLKVDITSVV